jgi:hypothetical protein
MFSLRKLEIIAFAVFVLLVFSVCPSVILFAEVTVNADYDDLIVPQINRFIFGMSVVHNAFPHPDSQPEGYAIYVDLAKQCGVTHLHIPNSAYWSHYNWLTGMANVNGEPVQGYSIADWKRFGDDTDVGMVGIISPHLYYSGYGGEDPGAVLQWCIDSHWDPDKWRYWAIGTECYGDWDGDYVADVNKYCAMVNEIAVRMKSVAPHIKIGVPFEIIWKPQWCRTVLQRCGDNIDFVDFHWYPHDGWTDPYGTMQHYPWLEYVFLPRVLSHFEKYLDGRRLQIYIGEFDLWGMDSYTPPLSRNTTLADALGWGDFFGQAIRLGIDMATGYDFSGTSSYALLLWWEELQHLPVKYRPQTWVLGMWSKYFGQSMVKVTVEGSPSYILPHDGRQEWANVDCCSWDVPPYSTYTAVPVDYVTAYAGIDSANNKVSLILINKHNDTSYDLSINLSNIDIDSGVPTEVYTLTTDHPDGLMAANRHWDPDPMQIPPPAHSTMTVGNSFEFPLGPHSMVTMRFPVASASDASAPAAITDLAASDPTSNSMTLSWTAPGDDDKSGTASQYDIRYSAASISEANWPSATQVSGEPAPQVAGSSQSMTVSGLVPSTTYYFAMKTADEVPNISDLSNVVLSTTQGKLTNQPPYFEPTTPDQSVDEGDNLNFAVSAKDPDGDTIILTVSHLPGGASFVDHGAGRGTFDWTSDYVDAGQYSVTFHASDRVNPPVDDEVSITVNDADATPPKISDVQSSGVTYNSAEISWDTDEPATSQVDYGLTTSYGSSTTLAPDLVTVHSQSLSGLSSHTLYHYRVRSNDAAGNESISSDYTFTSSVPPDTTPPAISNVSDTAITRREVTISWNTDELATSQVECLSAGHCSGATLDGNLVTTHRQTLCGLSYGTLYGYRVRSKDKAGNEAVSQDYSFTTAPRPQSPRPMYPPDGTTLRVPTSDLVVSNGTDALGFRLTPLFEIDTAIQFDSPNLQQSTFFALDQVGDSMSIWTVPQELTAGTYYWRAYAYTNTFPSDTSDPSRIFSFTVTSGNVADTNYQLTLEYPPQNDTVLTLTPLLVVRLASGYPEVNNLTCRFEIDKDPQFSSDVLSSERTIFSGDGTARWEVSPDLEQNRRFYWRAKLYSNDKMVDISRSSTMFTGAIHVFPNPFKPSLGHSHVTFRNVPINSAIRVTTISGDLVKAFDGTQQTDVVWDVRGEDQKESASGIYLYWVTHGEGVSSGKIFVIR